MDPLFERRELARTIHLDARFLQRNIDASLVAQLRMKYEGKCVAEGYIKRDSIVVTEHSLGRTNLIKGGVDYSVRFQADVCMPHTGQVFRAPVILKSKIGVHAEITPLKVLLPRDLHIANSEFETVEEAQEIEFEVVGSRFQQGDESIVVLAKLRQSVKPQVEAEPEIPAFEPLLAAPTSGSGSSEGSDKKMVTVDVASTKASEGGPRRMRIKPKTASTTNE